jgi:hypothetical protein
LVRLRRGSYPGSAVEDRRARGHPGCSATQGRARRNAEAFAAHSNKQGRPWTETGFRASFSTIAKQAGIVGLTFNDLRGTAVTRLALVGCTEAEIVTITGHSLRDVRSILDAHYLHRDVELARNAINKLEMHYAKQTG